MARNRIRNAVLVFLVAPLVAAGCAAGSHPKQAVARPAGSQAPTQSVPPVAAGLIDTTPAAPVTPEPAGSTVTTTGSGSVSGTPQVMTLSIGVTTTAPHAGEALSDNSAKASAVQASLRSAGVAAADIQTSQLWLSASYGNNSSEPAGYQATNTVLAKLRDLSKAGTVIDNAVAAAGDAGRLEGVSFSIDDASTFAAAARKIAVTQARSRADELAAAAGMKVVGLRSLTEAPYQAPYGSLAGAVPASAASRGSAAVAVPIQPGVQQTTVDVTAVWNVTPA
jgi:uncharacterized protein